MERFQESVLVSTPEVGSALLTRMNLIDLDGSLLLSRPESQLTPIGQSQVCLFLERNHLERNCPRPSGIDAGGQTRGAGPARRAGGTDGWRWPWAPLLEPRHGSQPIQLLDRAGMGEIKMVEAASGKEAPLQLPARLQLEGHKTIPLAAWDCPAGHH